MKICLYGLMDVKAKAFGPLMSFANDDLCKRGMAEAARDERMDFVKYPADFVMYRLGEYDSDNGVIVPCAPQVVAPFTEFVAAGRQVGTEV